MAAGEILIKWTSESSAAIRDMNRVNRALGDSASKSDRWARRIDTAGNIAMGVFAGMSAAAWKVTLSASDQEQAIGSLNAVFKKYSGEMETAAKAAYELGLSTTDYSQIAAVMGAQLKNLGLDTGEAADRTQELVNLGADLAAQFGGTTKDAVDALGSALRGERDPIERYGISLNQAAIKAKMADDNLTEVEAVLALLNEQAKKSGALGAAGREAETLASGLQQTQAAFQNLNASMGKALGGGKKGGALGDLARALNDVSTWVEEHPDTFNLIAKGVAGVTASLIALKGALAVSGALKTFLGLLSSPFVLAAGWAAFEVWLENMKKNSGGVYTVLYWLKRLADFMANPAGGAFRIAAEQLVNTLKNMWDVAKRLWSLFTGNSGGSAPTAPSNGVPGLPSNPYPRTPSLQTSSVGRIAAAAAQPVTNVFVDGRRAPARVTTGAWQPQLALGVV